MIVVLVAMVDKIEIPLNVENTVEVEIIEVVDVANHRIILVVFVTDQLIQSLFEFLFLLTDLNKISAKRQILFLSLSLFIQD